MSKLYVICLSEYIVSYLRWRIKQTTKYGHFPGSFAWKIFSKNPFLWHIFLYFSSNYFTFSSNNFMFSSIGFILHSVQSDLLILWSSWHFFILPNFQLIHFIGGFFILKNFFLNLTEFWNFIRIKHNFEILNKKCIETLIKKMNPKILNCIFFLWI